MTLCSMPIKVEFLDKRELAILALELVLPPSVMIKINLQFKGLKTC